MKSEASARDRLLAAADELFYEEGIHTVGIDRVIARAGVAKASLYSAFGSKEELVLAYLQARAEERAARITKAIARHDHPREQILAIFDSLAARVAEPNFRGCAFVNASAEGPPGDSKVRQACRGSRDWVRGVFTDLGRALGAADPGQLGRQLLLLYEGADAGRLDGARTRRRARGAPDGRDVAGRAVPEAPIRPQIGALTAAGAAPGGCGHVWVNQEFRMTRPHAWISLLLALGACAGVKQNSTTSGSGGAATGDAPGTGGAPGAGGARATGGGAPGSGGTTTSGTCSANLECQQTTCMIGSCSEPACSELEGVKTTLSGTIYDPAGKVPLYNVSVYVPNQPLQPVSEGLSCDQCNGRASGQPIASALTDASGHFTMDNPPVGKNIPMVIQIGKWRRQVVIPEIVRCTDNTITDVNLERLPRNQSEGHLPLIALTTGHSDALECLLRKIGVSDSEFTNDAGGGRVHLYYGGGDLTNPSASGAGANSLASGAKFASASSVWGSRTKLSAYDIMMLSCEGSQYASMKIRTWRTSSGSPTTAAASSTTTCTSTGSSTGCRPGRPPRTGSACSRIWATSPRRSTPASPRGRAWPTGSPTWGPRRPRGSFRS